MRPLIFAANWKMQIGPAEARDYATKFLAAVSAKQGRDLWFFPPAVSIEATALAFKGRLDVKVGAQDVYWELKGAYTGATSVPLASAAGATGALVGHSERRHVFGETEPETANKVLRLLALGLAPMLCVGEKLAEREAGATDAVCARQLRSALDKVSPADLSRVTVAYEPVWAIGTGKNATPADASSAHRAIRSVLASLGLKGRAKVLYGGSVNAGNAAALLAEEELDGVLVGGASLDPAGWAGIISVP